MHPRLRPAHPLHPPRPEAPAAEVADLAQDQAQARAHGHVDDPGIGAQGRDEGAQAAPVPTVSAPQSRPPWVPAGGSAAADASVRIEADDRVGLERLLRYCARPPFALERLEAIDAHRLIYRLTKPRPDGRTGLILSPLELIGRLVALIPPPRTHRHRYHGVLAPNATLRATVGAIRSEGKQSTGKNLYC